MHEAPFAQVLRLQHAGSTCTDFGNNEPGLPLISSTDAPLSSQAAAIKPAPCA